MSDVRSRPWFQDAYIRCAGVVMRGVMSGMTPRDSVTVIEAQLERAYRRGRADARDDVKAVARALRDKDCPYLGHYKLGYDAALDDVLRELPRRQAAAISAAGQS